MAVRLKSYLKFLWKSTNHHGVHSPFIFKLVTKCLYTPKPDMARNNFGSTLNKKQIELLYRVLYYFKGGKVMVLGPEAGPVTQIFRTAGEREEKFTWFFTTMAPVPGGVNIGFISHTDKEEALNLFEELLPFITNDTVCVIPNIHSSAEMEEFWEDIQRHPKVTVTVDVYHSGLVFFRKEQREQHFKIRM